MKRALVAAFALLAATSAQALRWDSGETWDSIGNVWDEATRTPTKTRTPTITPSPTQTSSDPTSTPTNTPTPTETRTFTNTPTNTPVNTATPTPTDTVVGTSPTPTPPDTHTPTPFPTETNTPTPTFTYTATETFTPTPGALNWCCISEPPGNTNCIHLDEEFAVPEVCTYALVENAACSPDQGPGVTACVTYTPTSTPTSTPTATPTGTPVATATPAICASGGTLTDPLGLCKPAYQTPDWHLWVNGNMDLIAALFDADSGTLKPEYGLVPEPSASGQIPFANSAATQYSVGSLYYKVLDDGAGYFGFNTLPSTQQFHLEFSEGDDDSRFVRIDSGAGRVPFFIGERLNDEGVPLTGEWSLGFNSIPRETTAVPEIANAPSWSLDLTQQGFSVRYTPLLSTTYATGIKIEPGVSFLGASVPPAAGVFTDDPQSAWEVPDGHYLQIGDHNEGEPPDADCNEDEEFGRVSFNTTAEEMCWCSGYLGWRCFGASEAVGETDIPAQSSVVNYTIAVNVPGITLDWTCTATVTGLPSNNPFIQVSARPLTNSFAALQIHELSGNTWSSSAGTGKVRCTK